MTLAEPASPVETTIAADTPARAHKRETRRLAIGSGWATLDATTGAPVQFTDDRAPERTFLLDDDVAWHSVEHAWGSGHIVADTFAGRWNAPSAISADDVRVATEHTVADRVRVRVERAGGHTLRETYRFRNVSPDAIRITSLAVQTPFADLYPGALDALTRRVHAHVFTGGAWSWVAAQPMRGEGRLLGLRLLEGELWGYSVETRNADTLSNARGHLVLHVTDHARNADAFGGQPVIELAPDAEYVLSWELAWHDDLDGFVAQTAAPAEFGSLRASIREAIEVHTALPVTAAPGVAVEATDDGARLTAAVAGSYWVQVGEDARTEVLFHDSVEDAVRKRVDYVLAHQRSTERPGLLAHAILPVDTTTRLTQATNGWSDWTDGSERIGVALMLQHAASRGWVGSEADDALDGWAAFAREHLMDDSAAPRRGSVQHHAGIRLYDSPWLSRFFLLRFEHLRHADDLDLAARLLERALELGIGRILTIGFSEVAVAVAGALAADGQSDRADDLRQAVVASGRHFAALAEDLPGHEVAYEQAMVAPLLNVLIDAHALSGDPSLLEAITSRLPWLLAFGGPQPHSRLQGVAIRHWDGYWFGQRRQWGDVFPHYWSALTATVLLRLPRELRSPQSDALADGILRANMANYGADGSATCAFVMPTSVDGVPAHAADPLANDQDFHLALWMQLHADGRAELP